MSELLTVIGHYVITGLFWLSALLQFGVLRDPAVYDTRRGEALRRVLCAGLVCMALRMTFTLIDVGQLQMPFQSAVGLLMVGLGLFGLSLERLVPHRSPRDPEVPRRRVTDFVPLD